MRKRSLILSGLLLGLACSSARADDRAADAKAVDPKHGPLAAKRVKLSFKDTPVIDAVDELVRQSGYNIQIQGNVDNLIKRTVTLETGETTFWQAFDQLCAKAGLEEVAGLAPSGLPANQPIPPVAGRRPPIQPLIRPLPAMPLPAFPGRPNVKNKAKPGLPNPFREIEAIEKAFGGLNGKMPFGGGGKGFQDLEQFEKVFQQQLEQLMQLMDRQLQMHMDQLRKEGGGREQFVPGFRDLGQQMDLLRQLREQGLAQLRAFQNQGLPGLADRRPQIAPDPEIRPIHVKDGTPRRLPTCYAGAVRVRLAPVEQGEEARRDGHVFYAVEVAVEPKVYNLQLAASSFVNRAIDDQGQKLEPTFLASGRGPRSVPQQPLVQVKLGDKAAKTLREVSGQINGQVFTQADPLIVVDDIFNAGGKTVRGKNGGSIEVFTVEKKGDAEVQIQLRLETPPAQGDVLPAGVPALLDAKGDRYQLVQVPSRSQRTNGRTVTQELTILYRANPGQGDPTRLVLNGMRPAQVELPFTVRNVPLP